ncbi:MAG: hypothetical protein ACKO5K_03105 [Armatimonadota bacterium]
MSPGVLALLIPIVALGLGAMGILTSHRERMAKLRLKANETSDGRLATEMKQLREELEALRAASTGFDLSFDQRLDRLEARTAGLESQSAIGRGTAPESSTARTLGLGG